MQQVSSILNNFQNIHTADYTVMGMEFAENLLLISRASSDAYEPYVFLKGHSEKSSNPDGQNDLL